MTFLPWWLWVLAGLWAASLMLARRLPRSSEWSAVVWGSLGVYTILLIYVTLQRLPATAGEPVAAWRTGLLWGSVTAALSGCGALLYAPVSSASRSEEKTSLGVGGSGHVVLWLGIAGLAASMEAYELAVLCLLPCGLELFFRQPADRVADEAPDAEDGPGTVLRRETVLIGLTVALGCVLWLGTLQYALSVESRPAETGRVMTALPAASTIERARQTETAGPPDDRRIPASLTLVAIAVVVWSAARPCPR